MGGVRFALLVSTRHGVLSTWSAGTGAGGQTSAPPAAASGPRITRRRRHGAKEFETANESRCTQNGAVARRPPKCDPKDLSACICVHARFHTSSAAPMNETVRHCRDSHRLTGAPGSAGVSTEPHAEWSHRLRMGRRPVIPRPLRGVAPLRCATLAPDPCAASPIALEPAPLGGAAAW
jgi:hypothetical protein